MQIDRALFPITTLGPNKRLGIWTVGCPHKCYNCSNPELWDADESKEVKVADIVTRILPYKDRIEGVTITGGDPFFQADELYELLVLLRKSGFKDILVYTGYSINELRGRYKNILLLIDVLIDGPYIDSLNHNVGIMGSSNQHIHILNPSLKDAYENLSICMRERQNFVHNGEIMSVGIPNK